ncbi:MAG: phenylacetate--CoA ligase family protein [Candidatus Aminicenantia bacterium]
MNNILYSVAEKLRGENIAKKIKELQETQYYSVAELQNYQTEKLKEILSTSKETVPYFREIIKDSKPDNINSIPILTKEIIRKNMKRMFNPKIPKWNFIKYSSSGITGEPIVLFLERSAVGYYHAAQWRGFSWHGVELGARGIKIWGVPISLKSRIIEKLKDKITTRIRISAFDMEKLKVKKIWNKIVKYKPEYMYGYASALYLFASLLEENNLEGKELGLKLIVSSGEVLYEFQREKLKKFFQCPVANEYGACEVGIIAFECPRESMHITSENIYIEVVDEDNVPREPTYEGKIIVTSLRNFGFPIIRYELGDVVVLSERECTCGIRLPLLEKINGRTSDFVLTNAGKKIHSEFFSYLNRELITRGYILREFKIVQKKKNELIVFLLKNENLDKQVEYFISDMIKKHIDSSMAVKFEYIEKIDLEKSGKKRYFVNEISQFNRS